MTQLRDLREIDAGAITEEVFESHDDLLERGISTAVTRTVHGRIAADRTRAYAFERIDRRETEIVVRVHGDLDLVFGCDAHEIHQHRHRLRQEPAARIVDDPAVDAGGDGAA